ncbi:hypothetical protein C8J56DRAFT_944317 [Mycena floridula]|nr:hypothetical protein C8J56DRAFT_944317 [Mycena floridula]
MLRRAMALGAVSNFTIWDLLTLLLVHCWSTVQSRSANCRSPRLLQAGTCGNSILARLLDKKQATTRGLSRRITMGAALAASSFLQKSCQ